MVSIQTCNAQQLTVSLVVDGDTFEFSNEETVRLIGIDTPEEHMSGKLRSDAKRSPYDIKTIQELGRKTSQYAKHLVQGERVELTYDQANAGSDNRGSYGRLLAYVWILNETGDREFIVNRPLVKDGYAKAYTKYPFKYADQFRRLERQARKQEREIYGMLS